MRFHIAIVGRKLPANSQALFGFLLLLLIVEACCRCRSCQGNTFAIVSWLLFCGPLLLAGICITFAAGLVLGKVSVSKHDFCVR